jgi:hypothetical protein
MNEILDPLTAALLVDRLSGEEAGELEAYAMAGVDPRAPEREQGLAYITRASEWLIRWRARHIGGLG